MWLPLWHRGRWNGAQQGPVCRTIHDFSRLKERDTFADDCDLGVKDDKQHAIRTSETIHAGSIAQRGPKSLNDCELGSWGPRESCRGHPWMAGLGFLAEAKYLSYWTPTAYTSFNHLLAHNAIISAAVAPRDCSIY